MRCPATRKRAPAGTELVLTQQSNAGLERAGRRAICFRASLCTHAIVLSRGHPGMGQSETESSVDTLLAHDTDLFNRWEAASA